MLPRMNFGHMGGPVPVFDMYQHVAAARIAAREAGINPTTGKPLEGRLLEAALTGDTALLEATPETRAGFAAWLNYPIETSFARGYDYVAAQWKRYVGVQAVNSFDEVRLKRKGGFNGFALVGDVPEYPGLRRTLGPESGIMVDTYGAIYSLTRKLMRTNGVKELTDDLPQEFGEAMAYFITQLVIASLVANPTTYDGLPLHSTVRGNMTTAALDENSFVDAAVFLEGQKDADGRPIITHLKTAVVQNQRIALRLRQIIQSQELALTTVGSGAQPTTTFGRGTSNPIASASILPADGIVVDPFLPDANDIYYFADPDRTPAIVAAFLDGQETPFIGLKNPEVLNLPQSGASGQDPYAFQHDTIDYKIRHDVGVAPSDPRFTYAQKPA